MMQYAGVKAVHVTLWSVQKINVPMMPGAHYFAPNVFQCLFVILNSGGRCVVGYYAV